MLKKILNLFFPKQKGINNKTILVVEDNPVDQRIAVAAIERGRYVAVVASDGKTGLELAKTHRPDLIILDYNLTDMTGPELCLKIRKHTDLANTPVLFVTSMETPSSVVECFDKGGDNYLSKPVSSKLLLNYIEDLLRENDHA